MTWAFRSTKKDIVISFDYDNDKQYRYLLSALKANPGSEIDFEDLTPGAINTSNVDRVKAVLTNQIRASTHLLVIVGDYANTRHPDSKLIGDVNWQWWEINQAKAEGKGLIGIKIKKENTPPTPLLGAGAKWAMSFTVDGILKAMNGA